MNHKLLYKENCPLPSYIHKCFEERRNKVTQGKWWTIYGQTLKCCKRCLQGDKKTAHYWPDFHNVSLVWTSRTRLSDGIPGIKIPAENVPVIKSIESFPFNSAEIYFCRDFVNSHFCSWRFLCRDFFRRDFFFRILAKIICRDNCFQDCFVGIFFCRDNCLQDFFPQGFSAGILSIYPLLQSQIPRKHWPEIEFLEDKLWKKNLNSQPHLCRDFFAGIFFAEISLAELFCSDNCLHIFCKDFFCRDFPQEFH